MDDMDAFLTEVGATTSRYKHPKLAKARKEHSKLMEIVESFGNKVSNMVDRQRGEYMQAYEQHMHDVQRELHLLREKVTELANDQTRGDKLKQLNADQKYFRQEALTYDQESAGLRKKIRRLKDTIQVVEKERDWLLKKLRYEKRRYNFIKEERNKMTNGADSYSSMSMSDSAYSLDIKPGADWRARLQSDVTVSRDQAIVSALPQIPSPGQVQPAYSLPNLGPTNPKQMPRVATLDLGGFGSGGGRVGGGGGYAQRSASSIYKSVATLSAEERRARGELVALKAMQEAMRDFISQCASSCGKGLWAKIPRRSLPEVLNACAEVIDRPGDAEVKEQQRQRLATELALHPETYSIIAGLMMGQFDDLEDQQGFGSSLGAYGDVLGEGDGGAGGAGGQGEDYDSALDGEWTQFELNEFEEVAGEFPRSSSAQLRSEGASRGRAGYDDAAAGSSPVGPRYGGASPGTYGDRGDSPDYPQSPPQSNRLLLDQDLSDYLYQSQQFRRGDRSTQRLDDDDDYDI